MIKVACAIIEHMGKILVTQRGFHKAEAGLWEFPGGKLEAGETAEACIIREIAEELDLHIKPYHCLRAVTHHYPEKSIQLIPLVCRLDTGSIRLKEHAAFRWLIAGELHPLDWCPADVPVLENYLQWLNQQSK